MAALMHQKPELAGADLTGLHEAAVCRAAEGLLTTDLRKRRSAPV